MSELHKSDEEITSPEKVIKKYGRHYPWWVVLLIATLPASVPAFFSYRASVVESKAKSAETRRVAEAGYDALVKAVDLLQKHDEETTRQLNQLMGEVHAMQTMRPHLKADLSPPKPIASATADLPKSLDEAAKK